MRIRAYLYWLYTRTWRKCLCESDWMKWPKGSIMYECVECPRSYPVAIGFRVWDE